MLQLKRSVRLERLGQPFKKALLTASRLGAEGVEINARSEIRPPEMSRTAVRHLLKMLADLNLKVSALHFPTRRGYGVVDDLERRIDATKSAITLAYELGTNVVINDIGRIAEQGTERHTLLEALTDIGRFSQKGGAWLAATTGSQKPETLKALIDDLPTLSLSVDFDPGNLIINGFSADDAVDLLGPHISNFRARDAVRDLAVGRGLEVQLGRGSVDWPRLLGVMEENHYAGYIAIDRHFESQAEIECGEAMEYLTNLFQ